VLVPAIHRKSATRVRGGRVAKKNNWVPDLKDYYARPQSEIQIERTDPGPGYRHVVTVSELRQFLEILPDWDELAVGLEAISIWRGNSEWLGISNPGVVVITAWPREMWWSVEPSWIEEEAEVLERLEVEVVAHPESSDLEVRWTPAQARAYMLTDVLVHELGHHHDRMTSRSGRLGRGERFAVQYASRVRAEVWPEYTRRFGI
jgi:hypothetical protein